MYALAMLNRPTPDRKAVDAMVRAATFMRRGRGCVRDSS